MLPKRAIDEVVEADPSCMALLAKSMQEAINLKTTLDWPTVAARLLRKFGSLAGIFTYMNEKQSQAEPGLVTWLRYQALMSAVRVAVLDQKLLWIDIDTEKVGSAYFKDFIDVVFSKTLTEEAQALEVLGNEDPDALTSTALSSLRMDCRIPSQLTTTSTSGDIVSQAASLVTPISSGLEPGRGVVRPSSQNASRFLQRAGTAANMIPESHEQIFQKLDLMTEQLNERIEHKVGQLDARFDALLKRAKNRQKAGACLS